jgi:hypothetical protein
MEPPGRQACPTGRSGHRATWGLGGPTSDGVKHGQTPCFCGYLEGFSSSLKAEAPAAGRVWQHPQALS